MFFIKHETSFCPDGNILEVRWSANLLPALGAAGRMDSPNEADKDLALPNFGGSVGMRPAHFQSINLSCLSVQLFQILFL
jgi:hypothetical protein